MSNGELYTATMIAGAAKLRDAQFMKLASLCFLSYDYLLTLPDEIEYVWPSPWSTLKMAFMAGRYLPFGSVLATVYAYHARSYPGDAVCIGLSFAHLWFMAVSILCCQIIQVKRTYALYRGTRMIGWVLAAMLALEFIPSIPLNIKFTNSLSMREQAPPWGVTASTDYFHCGTRLNANFKSLSPLYILVAVTEFLIIVLTGWKFFERDRCHMKYAMRVQGSKMRDEGHTIVGVLYKDGLMYFLYIFAFALANVLVLYLDESQYNKWPFQLQGVLQSCLGTRIVVHIRKTAIENAEKNAASLVELSELQSGGESEDGHEGAVRRAGHGRHGQYIC